MTELNKSGSNFYSLTIIKYDSESNLAKRRFVESYKYLSKFLKKDSKIIDLGCGCGLFSFNLEKKGFDVTGVDNNNEYLKIARKYSLKHNSNVKFFKKNLMNLNFKKKFGTGILMGNIMPHFNIIEFERIIKNIKNILLRKGLVIIEYNDWVKLFLNKYPLKYLESKKPLTISKHLKFSGEEGAVYREFKNYKNKFKLKLTVWSPFILDYLMLKNGFKKIKHINIKNNKYLSVYSLK